MSQRTRNDKKLRKAKAKVREATIKELDLKTEEIIKALKEEKWRYRALMALWLVLPGKGRK